MLEVSSLKFENARYERRFLISNLDLKEVEMIIKFNPFLFSEMFYKRRVNNIYLDSLDFGNYMANIQGDSSRAKIRIRWYGKMFGLIENPVLEIKIKNNMLGEKVRFPLKPFILDERFSNNFLQKKVFDKSNLPAGVIEILKISQLSLLNSYKRKYFISRDKQYRITLDEDLIFFKIKDRNNLFKQKIPNRMNIILELKDKRENDQKANQINQYFPFRMTKGSKYVYGLNLLS
jgi:SPX domain protein involved in polyphosphate accumulation